MYLSLLDRLSDVEDELPRLKTLPTPLRLLLEDDDPLSEIEEFRTFSFA